MRAEDIILNAIKKGEFIIDEDGQIWRHRKGKLVEGTGNQDEGDSWEERQGDHDD